MASSRHSASDGLSSAGASRRASARDAHGAPSVRSYSRSNYGSGDSARTPASSYSRRSTQAGYSHILAKRRRRKTIGIAVAIVAAVLLAGAGAAFAYVNVLNGKLGAGIDEDLQAALYESAAPTDPFYMLLMGTDKSASRDESGDFGGSYRSDSMILARIDPQNQQVTLVSIVRDTYVDMGEYGWNKINAAYTLGGAALAVQTVSEFAGVPISHYAEIDFDGFKAAVDALGGIEVNVPITIDDAEAGGYVEAGLQTLNGDQALILCRSRHAYDDYGAGDFYRAANQRLVMGAVAKKLLASDPATIASTVTTLCDYITCDMDVTELVGLAVSMRGMDTDSNIYSSMNPTVSTYEGGVWYEYSNDEAWSAMMTRIDAGLSPTVNEADSANNGGVTDGTISGEYVAYAALADTGNTGESYEVEVRNGSGVTGAAASVSSLLTNAGYDITSTGDADSYDYEGTIVVYGSDGSADEAASIVEALGVGTVLEDDGTYTFDGAYLVIVGADY